MINARLYETAKEVDLIGFIKAELHGHEYKFWRLCKIQLFLRIRHLAKYLTYRVDPWVSSHFIVYLQEGVTFCDQMCSVEFKRHGLTVNRLTAGLWSSEDSVVAPDQGSNLYLVMLYSLTPISTQLSQDLTFSDLFCSFKWTNGWENWNSPSQCKETIKKESSFSSRIDSDGKIHSMSHKR